MNEERFAYVTSIVKQLEEVQPITEERRVLYEEFLSIYATYAPFWIQYINDEIEAKEDERAMKLFYRCLPVVPDVELFQRYIKFITERNNDPREICAAYEYALSKVGLDMGAIQLYYNYVNYAESRNVGTEIVTIDKLRKVYQRALAVPMDGLQEFHKQYREFENRKAAQLANSILPDQERRFKGTATVYHNKKRYHRQLQTTLCTMENGGFDSLHRWRLFIEFEKTNPLTANQEVLRAFVTYAYKCALCSLRFCWILWHEYAQYMIQGDDYNEAITIYAQAIEILPNNLMLNFTYAELLESRKRASDAYQVYRNLLSRLENKNDYTLTVINFLKFLQRTEGPNSMRKEFINALEENKCSFHVILAVASIENSVNVNREAALRILSHGIKKFPNEPEFIEQLIHLLIKFNATDMVLKVLEDSKSFMPNPQMLEIYRTVFNHLLYIRGKEDLLDQIGDEIIKLDRTETKETMTLRRFFLPTTYQDS